jgi:alcohol dehydrogenase class IV
LAAADFTWHDGERTIRFGRGALADAPALLGAGYVLLTTARAQPQAPVVMERAAEVHHVGPGAVDELADALLDAIAGTGSPTVVALGGGRVIDTAKAVGAATGRAVAAIPTTLSAAEMTRGGMHARRTPPGTPHRRPAVVINDPALCASQPPAGLAASAANSLGHAVDGSVTTEASPVPTLAGHEAIRLTAAAYAHPDDPGRDTLALAALLSGYTIDASGYGLHHVASQTLRRVGGIGHGPANAAMLPHTAAALRARFPEALAAQDVAAGRPVEDLASLLAQRAGATSLGALGVPEDRLEACAVAAARRPELALTPPPADLDELRALYRAAW